ncbi:radical SAM protein [Cetobacterium sp.]|uniref:radical SAM protein n=1 Tax=Cetobacterium sp. TaxID=2071632 RepID=UPI003F3B88FA
MKTYDLKVGYSCNNGCRHCVISDSKDKLIREKKPIDLTTDECLGLIKQEKKNGAKHIVLTGGEISIRKDFCEILKTCKENELGITIQTNGRKIAEKNFLEVYNDIEDIKFLIALHGANPSTHDKITERRGSFEETSQSIVKIIENNKMVIIKVVISKWNIKELADIVKVVSKLGAKYICFAFPHGQGEARKNIDEIIPTYTSLKPHIDDLVKVAVEENIAIEFEAIPFCIIPKYLKMVGELNYFKYNTVCSQVYEDIFDWNIIRKDIKSKNQNCKRCYFDNFCEGIWSEYEEYHGLNELIPIVIPNIDKKKFEKKILTMLNK